MTYSFFTAIPWYAFAFVLAFLIALLVGWSLCRAAAIGDEQVRRAFAEWDADEVDDMFRNPFLDLKEVAEDSHAALVDEAYERGVRHGREFERAGA